MCGGGGGGGIMPLCTSSVSNTVQSQVNHFLPGGGGGLVVTYQHITTTHRTLQLFSSTQTLDLQPITQPDIQENPKQKEILIVSAKKDSLVSRNLIR